MANVSIWRVDRGHIYGDDGFIDLLNNFRIGHIDQNIEQQLKQRNVQLAP